MTLDSIIEGCRKGDAVMQKALYDRYSGRFYVLCRRYTSDDATAQEVLSDGFLSVFEQMGNYRGEGSFEGWMQTIFVRCAIRRYKQDLRRIDRESFDDADVAVDNIDNSARMDVRQALMCAMRRLPVVERQAFNLVAVEGCKLEDASKLLEENLSTFKSRYYKALQKMRTMLTRYLGEEYLTNNID